MKVFISWSGPISQKVAIALKNWLPSVIQAIDPFVSSEDIERGARWFIDISTILEEVNFGILCITPQNMNAPWILFEAGALSKSIDESRVSPLLIGVKNSDLKGPLSQFNTTSIERKDILKLVKTINNQLGESALPLQNVEHAFEKWWSDLESVLGEVVEEIGKTNAENPKPQRPQEEILEEILELTRGVSKELIKTTNPRYLIESVPPSVRNEVERLEYEWDRLTKNVAINNNLEAMERLDHAKRKFREILNENIYDYPALLQGIEFVRLLFAQIEEKYLKKSDD